MRRAAAATVFGCASALLGYPDTDYADDLAAVARAVDGLPRGPARQRLAAALDRLTAMSELEAAACYVSTFDLHRRRTLHLTYYRHGDTRERGMALAALVRVYREAGFALVPGELPDFLPALLELAAVSPSGEAMLGEHRPAIDALRDSLEETDSPYGDVVAAVCDVLRAPSRADRQALRRYRAEGPPTEQVGLEPFAPPEVVKLGITRR